MMWDAWDGGWSWGWGMGLMMVFGWLVPLLLLGLIVYAVVQVADRGRGGAVVYSPPQPGAPPAPPAVGRAETPLDVAQRRYASGEISREEFVRIRDDLGGGGGAPAAG